MNDRLRDVLARTGRSDLDKVAAGVVGPKASVIGKPFTTAVLGHIVDPRTLGVVKLSGMAETGNGSATPWLAVAKAVDPAKTTVADSQWTRPEIEKIVYEGGT